MSDKKAAYKQLLISLKKCELNYHAHVREFGKLGQSEINFWAEQLQDMSAERIERLFGKKEADNIREMTKITLKRKIFENE